MSGGIYVAYIILMVNCAEMTGSANNVLTMIKHLYTGPHYCQMAAKQATVY